MSYLGVPPSVAAVTTDAVVTPYHAIVQVAQVKKGETVAIFGLGGLGFNALQIILSIGARPIIVDIRQDVLDEAVKFGVPKKDVVPPTVSASEFVSANKILVDTAFDFVGRTETFTSAQQTGRFYHFR
jgi:propanol-preferring alcohol dehydrogenase